MFTSVQICAVYKYYVFKYIGTLINILRKIITCLTCCYKLKSMLFYININYILQGLKFKFKNYVRIMVGLKFLNNIWCLKLFVVIQLYILYIDKTIAHIKYLKESKNISLFYLIIY